MIYLNLLPKSPAKVSYLNILKKSSTFLYEIWGTRGLGTPWFWTLCFTAGYSNSSKGDTDNYPMTSYYGIPGPLALIKCRFTAHPLCNLSIPVWWLRELTALGSAWGLAQNAEHVDITACRKIVIITKSPQFTWFLHVWLNIQISSAFPAFFGDSYLMAERARCVGLGLRIGKHAKHVAISNKKENSKRRHSHNILHVFCIFDWKCHTLWFLPHCRIQCKENWSSMAWLKGSRHTRTSSRGWKHAENAGICAPIFPKCGTYNRCWYNLIKNEENMQNAWTVTLFF